MFRSLCKSLFENRVLQRGNSKPLSICSNFTSQNHYFLLLQISGRSISSSSSIDQNDSSSSIVVSYLMNSCGLTENQALSASNKLNFKTTSNPDSVLSLFEDYGFTKSDISKIITKRPRILSSDIHKTLKPKLDYFNSKDISRVEVAKVISTNPTILERSLEKSIIPFFDYIKDIVGIDRYVFTVFRRSRYHPVEQIENLMHNIQVLRDEGVPQSNIVKFLIYQPMALMMTTVKFKEIAQEIKGMSFDPNKTSFLTAIHVLKSMAKSTWEAKLNAYRKWGWSEEQIQFAFMSNPQCMRHSEKKISGTMDFLVNQMGISSLLIARCPEILTYSLEKRIIPRSSVYQILISKGLIKDQISLFYVLKMTEQYFLKKFLFKYGKEAPELLEVWKQASKHRALEVSQRNESILAKQIERS